MRRPPPVGVRIVVLPAVLAVLSVLLPGCALFRELGLGGDDPQWVERRYRGVSSSTALQLAQTAIRDRYPPQELDLYRGTLKTGWVYGRFTDVTHQAVRARVLVEAEPEGDVTLIKMRVQQETSQSAGRVVTHDPGDWEPFEDDPFEAKRLLTKLHVLMRDVAELVPAAGEAAQAPGS